LRRYKNSDAWFDADGNTFIPGVYHYVGGCGKLYGANLPRMRESDFGEVVTHDGPSRAWPFSYDDIEPFYLEAEQLYWVHGDDSDPTGPRRSAPFPYPAIEHQGPIAEIAERMRRQGLHPCHFPLGVNLQEGGSCVLCRTCDSYSCLVDAKGESDVCAIRPALDSATVRLLTNANVLSVSVSPDGSHVTGLEVQRGSRRIKVEAQRYVVAAGAVNTAALLLRSRTESLPQGVANRSGMLGHNYMAHTATFLIAIRPTFDRHLFFEKTMALNDWYHAGADNEYPLGNVQTIGKLYGATIKGMFPQYPRAALEWIARRSVEFYLETEDLPQPGNEVKVDDAGRVHLLWKRNNEEPHQELVRRFKRALLRSGYPLIFTQPQNVQACSHQCGTARMGTDPEDSVVGVNCRAHDVDNLWIMDSSVFPSSNAVNPALTIAANVLRVAAAGELTQ
jgi:choline dehydrogenase-like flavoprotein